MPESYLESPLSEVLTAEYRLAERGRAGVVLRERPFLGHYNLRGRPDDSRFVRAVETIGVTLPLSANTVLDRGDRQMFWLGPDEWLLTCEPQARSEISTALERVRTECFCAVNDVSGGQTIVSLSGANASDVLAKGCTLDLHPRVFAPGQCAQTNLAKCVVLIRPMASNHPQYDVIVRRSFADYLWRWLLHSSLEYGYVTSGD